MTASPLTEARVAGLFSLTTLCAVSFREQIAIFGRRFGRSRGEIREERFRKTNQYQYVAGFVGRSRGEILNRGHSGKEYFSVRPGMAKKK